MNEERNRYSKLLRIMNPKNIYIAGKTGLLFRLPPHRTLSLKGGPCNGGKKSKDKYLSFSPQYHWE
jgi:hypothetical protein